MSVSSHNNRRLFWSAVLIPILLLGGTLAMLLADFEHRLEFAHDEQVGVRYVGALQSVILDLQKVRGLSHIDARLGDKPGARVTRLQRRIHRQLTRLEEMDGARFPEFTELIRRAHQEVHRQFVKVSTTQGPDARFARYTGLVERLQRVMRWVADRSRLVLDPERRTYYLMRLYVEDIPTLIEALGRLRGLRSGLMVEEHHGRAAQERVHARVAAARAELEESIRTFRVLGFFEPNLQGQMSRRTRRAEQDTRNFFRISQNLPDRPVTGERAVDYFNRATALIDRWAAVNSEIQQRFSAGLKARQAQLGMGRFLGAAGIGAAIAAMIVVFAVSFRREARFRARLQQETELSTALLQNLPGLFFLLDGNRRLLQWNGPFETVTGYSGDALRGRDVTTLFDPDEQPRIESALHDGLTTGYCELDAQLVTHGRGHLWYHFTASRVELRGVTHLVGFAVDIGERKRMEGELRRLASTDALTGLFNRPRLEEYLDQAEERFHRHGHPYALVMFDVDYFKQVNDTYGHERGDVVLQQLSRVVARGLRTTDILARWGGEEFMILAQDSDRAGAEQLAERLRAAVAAETFEGGLTVTISVGVAAIREEESRREVIQRVDGALYRAKEEGRNRVASADD